jgi:uncharacterized protein (DUF2252 family)
MDDPRTLPPEPQGATPPGLGSDSLSAEKAAPGEQAVAAAARVVDEATVAQAAAYGAAWAPEPPAGDVWTPRPWVHPSVREEQGRLARKRVSRASHATFEPRADRDPIAILEKQEADRLDFLIPLRHARMAESPFAYFRGTPAVMAFDLATTPRTDIFVQASGDAHLSNFGLFASPERRLVFDANDFDETLLAPWEWDVKRLAASIVIAGRANGFSASQNRAATTATVLVYREWMARFAEMRLIDVWYSSITDDSIRAAFERAVARYKDADARRAKLESIFSKARSRDQLRAAAQLTTIVDGRRVVVDDPPVVQHIEIAGGPDALRQVFEDYRATMAENRREFLERYRFADFALKVVGVGSVGTRCFVMILEGRDENDPLILQAKEATTSVLEEHVGGGPHANHGERVVVGQRLMQGTPDIFLGWTRGPAGRDFYVRQLWDMKGSVDPSTLRPEGLGYYGGLCAWALARAHARGGDAVAIASYLGTSDRFDGAVADFAEAYADQNERDHAAYVAAIEAGRVSIPVD